jgi:predicted PhzF superfamily epimerase YddE/YHI9
VRGLGGRAGRLARRVPRSLARRLRLVATAVLHVVRVFVGDDDGGGNPLGVFLDGGQVAAASRQPIAAELGFSETVFVDEASNGELRIFTPAVELPFAGHPLVGTAWLLARERSRVTALNPPAAAVPTWERGGFTWIRARPEDAPRFDLVELENAAAVDRYRTPAAGDEMLEVWAWRDESKGEVRARVFAGAVGVAEDEATGAAAVGFVAHVRRSVRIHQGRGSLLLAKPGDGGTVDVGGRVELVEVRQHPLP